MQINCLLLRIWKEMLYLTSGCFYKWTSVYILYNNNGQFVLFLIILLLIVVESVYSLWTKKLYWFPQENSSIIESRAKCGMRVNNNNILIMEWNCFIYPLADVMHKINEIIIMIHIFMRTITNHIGGRQEKWMYFRIKGEKNVNELCRVKHTVSQSVSQSPEAIVDMPHTNSVLGFSTKSFSTLKPSRATITDPPFQIICILHSWIVEQNSWLKQR